MTTSATWPIDYASTTVPTTYACKPCGAHGCKLWRLYGASLKRPELTCFDCTFKAEGKDLRWLEECARRLDWKDNRAIEIGQRIPAVPMAAGDFFWSYGIVPDAGIAWWRALPTRVPR